MDTVGTTARNTTGRFVAVFASLTLLMSTLFVLIPGAAVAASSDFGDPHFQSTWAYTDQPVVSGLVSRTWMWGPQQNGPAIAEPYWDSSTGWRKVAYFDKTRMEITDPAGDQSSIWYVTNGLLAKELITGDMQIGDDKFVQFAPAQVNVAGDANDPNGPTYATFNALMSLSPGAAGSTITQTVDRTGTVATDASLASYGVTAQEVGALTHHTVASAFWTFMTSTGLVEQNGQTSTSQLFQNPFYATGYPLTEAYWTHVLVGGVQKLVLVQVFERRVLTYTPDNPDGWKVEAGNVGQHYYTWRYTDLQQTVMPLLDLDTTPASAHSCQPFQASDPGFSADPALRFYPSTFYGENVTVSYTGTLCSTFHFEDGVAWNQATGTVAVYHGTDTSVAPFDTRPFTNLTVFQDPTNYSGATQTLLQGGTCSAVSFYSRSTVDNLLVSTTRKAGDTWDSSTQVLTNPVTNFDSPGPCTPPQCALGTLVGSAGSLGVTFDARLEPNSIAGDPQGEVAYMFLASGVDLSTVNVADVVQGPSGSTPIYHGGNCFFLYMNPSTPAGDATVSLNIPGSDPVSTTFTYVPAIGNVPADGAVLDLHDLTSWPTDDKPGWSHSVSNGTFHIRAKKYGAYAYSFSESLYGDASASLDVKLDTPGSSGVVCLAVHTDETLSTEIDFCLLTSGETVVNRYLSGINESILERAVRPGANATTSWNTLKIVSKGDLYWFLLNGTVIGSAQHSSVDGSNPGYTGFWIQNSGDAPLEWEFNNLITKAIQ